MASIAGSKGGIRNSEALKALRKDKGAKAKSKTNLTQNADGVSKQKTETEIGSILCTVELGVLDKDALYEGISNCGKFCSDVKWV